MSDSRAPGGGGADPWTAPAALLDSVGPTEGSVGGRRGQAVMVTSLEGPREERLAAEPDGWTRVAPRPCSRETVDDARDLPGHPHSRGCDGVG